MNGVPFSLDGEGRVLASWMSRDRVYWSLSDRGASKFGPPIAAPDEGRKEASPLVIANRRGDVLLVWKEGRRVNWAGYDRRGRLTGERGTAGETSARDRPMAFVGKDERFHVIL
jgi:hypothetical protein